MSTTLPTATKELPPPLAGNSHDHRLPHRPRRDLTQAVLAATPVPMPAANGGARGLGDSIPDLSEPRFVVSDKLSAWTSAFDKLMTLSACAA